MIPFSLSIISDLVIADPTSLSNWVFLLKVCPIHLFVVLVVGFVVGRGSK